MAWTAPMTATDNTIWTSAQFNTHVRDNLNETMPAKAAVAGNWIVVSGTNALVERTISESSVATSQTTTSTSYADLTTVGPAITATTGTSCIVFWAVNVSNSGAGGASSISVGITGATTRAASDTWRCVADGHTAANGARIGTFYKFTGLTAGSNVFTMKYKVGSGTGTFSDRQLLVMPL